MKVLHVISGLARGGAEASLCSLIAGASDVQHEVLVLSRLNQLDEQVRAAGAVVHYIDFKQLWAWPLRLWSATCLIKRSKPDVVQTWMYHADVMGGLLARMMGIRAVVWGLHHSCPDAMDLGRSARLFAWLSKQLSAWVPLKIAACSETSRQCHARYGYRAEKLLVIRNGYDLTRFSVRPDARARCRGEWGIDDGTPLLGSVARYHPVKGHSYLLSALAQLKTRDIAFKCVLVGDGINAENMPLRNLIEQLGLDDRIMLLGARSDIPDVMNALDMLVLSSLSEAFPNVLNEAMACGTPCVTTDVGDARHIIGSTGWMVQAGSVEQLADAMAEALMAFRNTASWSQRCLQARQRILEQFSLFKMVDAYSSCWHGLHAEDTGGVNG